MKFDPGLDAVLADRSQAAGVKDTTNAELLPALANRVVVDNTRNFYIISKCDGMLRIVTGVASN